MADNLQNLDVRSEARATAKQVRGNPVLIGAFCAALPLAGFLAAARAAQALGANPTLQLGAGAAGIAILFVFGFWLYRRAAQIGPTTVRLDGDRLRFEWDDGRADEWDLRTFRAPLLLEVMTTRGDSPDYLDPEIVKALPQPFIQRGFGTRYTLSNEAVRAVKERLLSLGRKPKVTDERLPSYSAVRYQFD